MVGPPFRDPPSEIQHYNRRINVGYTFLRGDPTAKCSLEKVGHQPLFVAEQVFDRLADGNLGPGSYK
jgi:hypothetical protein